MSDDAALAATEQNAEQLLDMSDLEFGEAGEKTMWCTCRLPNGFEVTVSSAPVDPDDYDKDVGTEACISKLKARIIDLLAFQQHGPLQ